MSREAMTLALQALETLAHYENPSTKIQARKHKDGQIVTIYPHKVASDAAQLLRAALDAPPVAYASTDLDRCKPAGEVSDTPNWTDYYPIPLYR